MGLNGFGDGGYSKASTSITVTEHHATEQVKITIITGVVFYRTSMRVDPR
jgi:hypothetical protein